MRVQSENKRIPGARLAEEVTGRKQSKGEPTEKGTLNPLGPFNHSRHKTPQLPPDTKNKSFK